MSFYGLMEEAAEGQLSKAVRELWKKRNGGDPVQCQKYEQMAQLGTFLTFVVLLAIIGEAVVARGIANVGVMVGNSIGVFFLTVVATIYICKYATNYMPKAQGTKRRFDHLYRRACDFLGGYWEHILAFNEQELLDKAKAALKHLGWHLVRAEIIHKTCSKEAATAKNYFDDVYEVFKLMGWIEDVGYGVFIPDVKEVVAALEAEAGSASAETSAAAEILAEAPAPSTT